MKEYKFNGSKMIKKSLRKKTTDLFIKWVNHKKITQLEASVTIDHEPVKNWGINIYIYDEI